MAKKKIAGIDRPFKFWEFQRLVERIALEQKVEGFEIQEYFGPAGLTRDEEIRDICFDCVSEVCFGNCEGIYTDIVFWKDGERKRFAVAKTLSRKDEDFVKMSVFGAKIVLIIRKYIDEHEDEFTWNGFNVGHDDGEKKLCSWICGNLESAKEKARETRDFYGNAWIRDNSTRKYVKF